MVLSERTEDGKLIGYPPASVLDLDVNSAVVVHLSPEALAALARGQPVPSASRAETVSRLQRLAAVQEAVNAAARAFVEQDQVREAAMQRGVALAGDALERYEKAYAMLAAAFLGVQEYMGKPAFSALVKRSGSSVTAAAAQFLADEQKRLQDQVRDDLEKIPARVLTLTASIGNPPRAVHVPGYDDLAPGEARLVQKTRFRFDDEFENEFAAAKVLAAKASDWNALQAAAVDALRRRLDDVDKQMRSAADDAAAVAGKLERDVAEAVNAAAKDVRAAADTIQKSVVAAEPVVRATLHPPPGAEPPALLAGAIQGLQDFTSSVNDALRSLDAARKKLAAARATLAADVNRLVNGLSTLVVRLRITDVAGAPGAAPLAPQVAAFKVKLDEARDTEISLLRADRDDGDILAVSARILDGDGDGARAITGGETTTYFRVRSRGIVADTGAVVLFTRPIRRDPGPFVPAAGAYAVFRFKGWRAEGDANSSFWYYTAPGVGVTAVVIPRASDGTTQIAWMGTVHVFGDVLQAAVGTTTDAKPLWGIGLGLHRLAGLGKYFQ
jgi:hypothetical protein